MGNSTSGSHTQITDEQISNFSSSLPGSYYHVYHKSNLPTSSLTNPNFDPSASPESVINNWELIQVFDDSGFDIVHYPNQNSSIGENLNANCNKVIKKVDDSGELLESYEMVEHSEVSANSRQLNCTKDSNIESNLNSSLFSKLVYYPLCYLSGTEDMVVLYYTSMRGIRKTYDDCLQVRMILKSFGAPVDERDVSMDSKYKKELENVFGGKGFSLPKVFIRGKCFGGADEIKQLHEDGALAKLLEGFPVKDAALSVCCSCGDARFVVCCNCNGSRKCFEAGGMRMCTKCNENGLVHCPGCCS